MLIVTVFMFFIFIFMTKMKRDLKNEQMNMNEKNKRELRKPLKKIPKIEYDSSYSAGVVFI
jgi:hypothetical protein